MSYEIKRMLNSTARGTNSLTVAKAEAITAGGGWTIGAGITSAAADATKPSPYGSYSSGTLITTAASGSRLINVAVGSNFAAGGKTVTMFVKAGTLNGFQLGFNDTSVTDQATFLTNGLDGLTFPVSVQPTAGFASTHQIDGLDDWVLVRVVIMNATGGVTSGNAASVYFTPGTASKTIWAWGAQVTTNVSELQNGDGVTTDFTPTTFIIKDGDTVLASVSGVVKAVAVLPGANKVRFTAGAPAVGINTVQLVHVPAIPSTPYLSGLGTGPAGQNNRGTNWALPTFKALYGTGKMIAQLGLGGTAPTGTMTLYGRLAANLPWVSLAAYDESTTVANQLAVLDGYPEARFALTAFGAASTAQFIAWLAE